MVRFRMLCGLFVVVAAMAFARPAGAAQILINPGFETNDFTGWTALTGAGSQLTPWTVAGPGNGWFSGSSPLSGSVDAFNGFDGDAGLTYTLYQDATIAAGSSAILTTNHRIVFDSLGLVSTLPRLFEITVRDTSNALLATLFTYNANINGAPLTDTGWVNQSFDLSAFAGSTVRITFFESIPETFTGPANLELDDITLDVTAVPEPGTVALVGLGLVAAAVTRRKRARV